jgi:hypothetical protein
MELYSLLKLAFFKIIIFISLPLLELFLSVLLFCKFEKKNHLGFQSRVVFSEVKKKNDGKRQRN